MLNLGEKSVTRGQRSVQRLAVVLPDPEDPSVKTLRYVEPGQAFVQPDPGDNITVEAFDTDFIVSRDAMSFSISWNVTNTVDGPITIVEHKLWFRAGSHWNEMWLVGKGDGMFGGETVTIDPGETTTNSSTFDFGFIDPLLSSMEKEGADPEFGVWFIPEFFYSVDGETEKHSYTPGLYHVAIDS